MISKVVESLTIPPLWFSLSSPSPPTFPLSYSLSLSPSLFRTTLMGGNPAPKSFKKFARKSLKKVLAKRPKQQLQKRQIKERTEKRLKRDQDQEQEEEEARPVGVRPSCLPCLPLSCHCAPPIRGECRSNGGVALL